MANCWSCGTEIPSGLHWKYWLTCPTCTQVEETKKIRETLESSGAQSLYGAIELIGLEQLTEGLSEIASILEWGFEEINWRLDQISETLDSIDRTLKSPATTRAREWCRIAEELRRRKVLDKSKKFFLKSLDANPLDYRTYIGLGKTCLELGDHQKARFYWTESLPYAPKGEIDYKSYTYRLLGRLDFCENDPRRAASALQIAIKLSPTYGDGHYDYAQYCAQIGNTEDSLLSLQRAILIKPAYWYLAQKERNFCPVGSEVEKLLSNLIMEASGRAKDAIAKSENTLKEVRKKIFDIAWGRAYAQRESTIDLFTSYLNESHRLEDTVEEKFKLAKDKLALGDYIAFLEAKSIAEEIN